MAVEAKVRLLAARLRCPLCLEPLEAETPPAGPDPVPAPFDPSPAPPPDPPATCPDCSTAYHAACVVELGVFCTTIGCAQGPKPPPKRGHTIGVQVRPRVGLVVPLVLTWLFYVPWPLGLIAWGWTLWRARRRRRRSAWAAALLLSPFVVVPAWSAGVAVYGYVTGTAVLTRSLGPADWRDWSDLPVLDPEVRCSVWPRGQTLGPAIPDVTNELVLRGLAWVFGPMAHAYTGPIPTSVLAGALLTQGRTVAFEQADAASPFGFDPDRDGQLRFTLDGEQLDLAVSPELYWRAMSQESATAPHRARVARLGGGGLLFSEEDRSGRTLLVDVAHRRAVAVLVVTPAPQPR